MRSVKWNGRVTFLVGAFLGLTHGLVVLEGWVVELIAHCAAHRTQVLAVNLLVLFVPAALKQLGGG